MLHTQAKLAIGAGFLSSLILGAQAVPSVNVALQTSFGAPPFLVELLETAAEENATAYFPLLDRIADGYFDSVTTDKDVYERFRELLQKDGHLDNKDLSSFDYAVAIHSAAPRVAAHFQFYNTSIVPSLSNGEGDACTSWVHVPFSGQRYCSPDLQESTSQSFGTPGAALHPLPFDRVLGDPLSERPSVVYADIASTSFRQFHKTLSKTAKEGKTSYRVRYRSPADAVSQPLTVSGYGVELALKRTDYIVIDDRQAEEEQKDGKLKTSEATLSEEDVSDLRPLSQSELLRLGMKAASFVLESDSPFDTLLRLSQDFPKHSGSIAGTNISESFAKEHRTNREGLLPAGANVLWINGVQIIPRDVDAYSLLEHLRRERKMINSVREIGLSGAEAIDLLSHEAITASHADQDMQRYDWRDDVEGDRVIIWMNDIEKDSRYREWPDSVMGLLQRTYPGQLPSVRKDIHNVVIPIDFGSAAQVAMVVETVQSFVKRKVPVRFGLVPRSRSEGSDAQAGVLYYLVDRYGLAAALDYLLHSLEGAGRKHGIPQQQYFNKAVEERNLRKDKVALAFDEITQDHSIGARVKSAHAYLARLGDTGEDAPILVNGVPIPGNDEWLQSMSQRIGVDGRIIQQAVFEGTLTEESYIPETFLAQASARRNPLIVPEDDKATRHINLGGLPEYANLPSLPADSETIERELVHLTVAADLGSKDGFEQLMETLLFQKEHDNVEVSILHVPHAGSNTRRLSSGYNPTAVKALIPGLLEKYSSLHIADDTASATDGTVAFSVRQKIYDALYDEHTKEITSESDDKDRATWTPYSDVVSAIGLQSGQKALVLNGRVVGPVSESATIELDDLEALFTYERKKRLLPAALAIQSLKLEDKSSSPLTFARISNLISLSSVSDIPEGIFEAASTVRTALFKTFNSSATSLHVGDEKTATIQIHASVDPTSETGQRWIPILKVLSELNGVYTRIFLNPRERLDELPIKRFYRTVLSSRPTFEEDGSLHNLGAHFVGLPADALLNMGMDLPPSWLVAPQTTVHDLDNIKLSAIKSGSDINAVYGLEHILLEGHSRETAGPPPRGAQLVLQTDLEPHFADTIIMANLGYFQFKANPGVYNLALQRGRSEEIFKIDSAGTLGYGENPGDEVTEIALMSFRGATLFPRISRKAGMEEEDVLEPSKTALESLAGSADKLLSQAGLKIPEAGKYISRAAKFGSGFFGSNKRGGGTGQQHADINIFSVASGHLYERMLNIMMVSVMKHTNHTVKFWFIEQFLSPSFKDFLPVMAEEYGFEFEMVTYKWPHWLRGQKEKQREIWGYKILFLDVLFPLDLDKVIFVDADQIVRTDMYDLVQHDLHGAPYGFTPMCDSRTEMEGFRFWKQGYWKQFLKGLPYHISALYVVDLKKFRQIAAGDRLRQNYHQLSADPNSLSNLDQDLPNHMQSLLPIHSLPQEWLWCETWCSDESLKDAKTIDLCNNPQTKEPKLDRARRQVPEWTVYDDEIAAVAKRYKEQSSHGGTVGQGETVPDVQGSDGESIQERLQREDAERERQKAGERIRDEL